MGPGNAPTNWLAQIESCPTPLRLILAIRTSAGCFGKPWNCRPMALGSVEKRALWDGQLNSKQIFVDWYVLFGQFYFYCQSNCSQACRLIKVPKGKEIQRFFQWSNFGVHSFSYTEHHSAWPVQKSQSATEITTKLEPTIWLSCQYRKIALVFPKVVKEKVPIALLQQRALYL